MLSTTSQVDFLLRVLLFSTVATRASAQNNCHWRSFSSDGNVCCNNKCTKNGCLAFGCGSNYRECDRRFTGVNCNECLAGFTGASCDININDCPSSNACSGHGTCKDGINYYTCSCDDGWAGSRCQRCRTGFTGASCDININDCASSNACSGHGTCIDGIDKYTCRCDDGWRGSRCQSKDCGKAVEPTVYCTFFYGPCKKGTWCDTKGIDECAHPKCDGNTCENDEECESDSCKGRCCARDDNNCLKCDLSGNCVDQWCNEGERMFDQQCIQCPENTFQTLTKHQEQQCTPQPTCGVGQYISRAFSTAKQICSPCPPNTFQNETNHRIETCTAQPTCSLGNYISAASSVLRQICKPCDKDTGYINVSAHRIETCFQQPFCGVGEYFTTAGTADSHVMGKCLECKPNGYQTQTKHQEHDCTPQSKCGKGEFITASSSISERSCKPCKGNTYNDQIGHRDENCTQQPLCGLFEYYFAAPDNVQERICIKCKEYTFQTLTNHSIEACTDQPKCGPGEMYDAPATKNTKGACNPCTAGTYQWEDLHRNDKCIDHAKCSGTFTGNLTNAGECTSPSTTDRSTGNGGVIGAAAGGFVCILGLGLFIYIVCTRRAAAKRAETALNSARKHLGIPCKDQHCSECSNIAEATPALPIQQQQQQQQQQPATAQPQCIQKTSAGTRCCNMAMSGSPRCNQHTCQYPGCMIAVSAKYPYCKTHANAPSGITISNPTFVGVVLTDAVAGYNSGDSSTDPATVAPTKFVVPANTLQLGGNTWASKGLTNVMGVDDSTYRYLSGSKAIKKILSEFKKSGTKNSEWDEGDLSRINGLINGTYFVPEDTTRTPLASLQEVMASMDVIHRKKPAWISKLKSHGLDSHHVLAIRLYTTKCYQSINKPMRAQPHPQLPHPFAATIYYITTGLEILRSAAADADKAESEKEKTFFRGMNDIGIAEDFTSGTDMSCMSTTESASIAIGFAIKLANKKGLIFRVVSDNFMSRGASVSFLSVYPEEMEFMYPPLTYLKKDTKYKGNEKDQKAVAAMASRGIEVVTVRPTYPKT